jgi:hypothetical protein
MNKVMRVIKEKNFKLISQKMEKVAKLKLQPEKKMPKSIGHFESLFEIKLNEKNFNLHLTSPKYIWRHNWTTCFHIYKHQHRVSSC